MAYMHRVHSSEIQTGLVSVVSVPSAIPFIVGTAPVNMADGTCNKVKYVQNYAEAVKEFGFVPPKTDASSGLKKYEYSISEFIYSQFQLFGVGPALIVNVLDPATHKSTATTTKVTLDTKNASVTVPETGIILSSITLSSSSGSLTAGTDFLTAFNDNGELVITSLKDQDGDFICPTGTELTFAAEKCDPSKVTTNDIIGGVSTGSDGLEIKKGMELVEDVFPLFGVVPGFILAPGFSDNSTVATIMAAKAVSINEVFRAICLCDVPTNTVKSYTAVSNWKNTNNIVDTAQVLCWPLLQQDGVVYHISTQLAALMARVDGNNGGVPYESPSNKTLSATGMVLADGTEVALSLPNAEHLNSQGVVTGLNFIGGLKAFGNRTACYPSNTDPKDSFIPIRRMMCWISNTIVLTCWQFLDKPLNRRQVQTITNTDQVWLNGLVAREYLIAATIEFREDENPITDLSDGISRFHLTVTPPSPNRDIEFIVEYDPTALSALFS